MCRGVQRRVWLCCAIFFIIIYSFVNVKDLLRYNNRAHMDATGKWWRNGTTPSRYQIYFYSAYFDDRAKEVVGVISYAELRQNKVIQMFKCAYDRNFTTYQRAKFVQIGIGGDVRGKRYQENILSCEVPPNHKPTTVHIISGSTVLSTLRITYPMRPSAKRSVIGCGPLIYNRIDPMRLIEWIELQKLWGVEHLYVYNTTVNYEALIVLKKYVDTGYVSLTSMPMPVSANTVIARELLSTPAINDCIYHNMHSTNYVVVMDIDEFITPRLDTSYPNMLKRLKRMSVPHKMSFVFRNVYFFSDVYTSDNEAQRQPLLRTATFLKHVATSPEGYSVKSIVDPSNCIGMHNHRCWHFIRPANAEMTVDPKIGANHHYKKCHFGSTQCKHMLEHLETDSTMLKFEKLLRDRVSARAAELTAI